MTRFDSTSALRELAGGPGAYELDLDPSWASLRGVHGGFVASLAVRAVDAATDDRRVRTVSTSFLRPATVGPARIDVRTVREGRTLSSFAVTLSQDDRPVATSRVTAVAEVAGEVWEVERPLELPPVEECIPIVPPDGVRHFTQAEGSLDPAALPFTHGPRATVRGYVRPLEARPVDAAWLTMILDWFPPSPFTRNDPPVGGVSVDFTAHVHRTMGALGPDKWLTGVFEADISADGLALEHGAVRDPDGRVIAESFHTRWTA